MRAVLWTEQARSDLAAIRAFISQDPPQSCIRRGRPVDCRHNPRVREVVHRPYRIVYRLVDADQIHILTVHHGSQRFPSDL